MHWISVAQLVHFNSSNEFAGARLQGRSNPQRPNTLALRYRLSDTAKTKEAFMKTAIRTADVASSAYVVTILALVGVFAVISSILIAWPALAYIAAKLF